MSFSLDEAALELEAFLKEAAKARLQAINEKISQMLNAGAPNSELDKWLKARTEYQHYVETGSLRAGPASSPAADKDASTEVIPKTDSKPDSAPARDVFVQRSPFVPEGAVPNPERYSRSTATKRPAARSPKPQSVSKPGQAKSSGGMLGFLQNAQQEQAPAQPEKKPPSGAEGGMLSFLKTVKEGASAPPEDNMVPEPAHPQTTPSPQDVAEDLPKVPGMEDFDPSTIFRSVPGHETRPEKPKPKPQGGGSMLNFLQKMQSSDSQESTEHSSQKATTPDVVESMKAKASSSGFKDVYEMLRFKREKLVENRQILIQSQIPEDDRTVRMIDNEISTLDELMTQSDQTKIAKSLREFQEVAKVDKGRLGELGSELKGLFDEIQ